VSACAAESTADDGVEIAVLNHPQMSGVVVALADTQLGRQHLGSPPREHALAVPEDLPGQQWRGVVQEHDLDAWVMNAGADLGGEIDFVGRRQPHRQPAVTLRKQDRDVDVALDVGSPPGVGAVQVGGQR
jgi:hypothetical protein